MLCISTQPILRWYEAQSELCGRTLWQKLEKNGWSVQQGGQQHGNCQTGSVRWTLEIMAQRWFSLKHTKMNQREIEMDMSAVTTDVNVEDDKEKKEQAEEC